MLVVLIWDCVCVREGGREEEVELLDSRRRRKENGMSADKALEMTMH